MNTRSLLLSLLLSILLPSGLPAQEKQAAKGDWQLAWSDEFNGNQIDTLKWNILTRETSKHNELQYYLPDEVYIENGTLRIRSRIRKFGSKEYTSGRVDTRGKMAPVYGRFEIRAKLPGGRGLWPAFWLYPQNRDWPMEMEMAKAVAEGNERLIPEERPWYSEIDIMEFLGHETGVIYGTHHYYSFDGRKMTSSGTLRSSTDFTEEFHIYALEWEPDAIRWYVDGELIHMCTDGVPHTPHYLIINTAIGGSWPGNPDSTTFFPQYLDVDYVRVYSRKTYFPSAEADGNS